MRAELLGQGAGHLRFHGLPPGMRRLAPGGGDDVDVGGEEWGGWRGRPGPR